LKTTLKITIVLAVILVVVVGFYLQQGGWMMWNPKYDQAHLLGLTSAQVVQSLGTPSHDPRIPIGGGSRPEWSSEADGPLYLGYFQGWGTCVIEFQHDRVVSVKRGWK
jgi:hypothetical protein